MQVLAYDQQRSLPCQALELVKKRGEGLSPYLHRTQAKRWIPLPGRYRKEHGNERRCLCPLRPERKHCLKLVEFLLGRVVRCDAGGTLELSDKGIKRAVRMVGRALIPQPAVRLQRRTLRQRRHQTRFADPGLT